MGRRPVIWLLVATLLTGCSGPEPAPAPSPPGPSSSPPLPRTFHDVAYATVSPRETLDLYLPEPAATPAPLVVWVHGGGWRTSDKASAGGYNTVMAGVTGATTTEFDDPALGSPGVSSAVQAVVDWFGPTDAGNIPGDLTAAQLPYAFIKPGAKLPPFLIAHGDADCIVPVAASRRLHDALKKAGADATLTVVPGAHHEDPAFMRTQLAPAMAFLDRVVGS